MAMKFGYTGVTRGALGLKVSSRLKRRTSSRLPTPVQGRIKDSNSNTSKQIVIHIGTLFFSHYFELEQPLPFGIEKVDRFRRLQIEGEGMNTL